MNITKRQILEQLIAIGGIATINNFFSPNAGTLVGGKKQAFLHFKSLLKNEFIKKLDPVVYIRNTTQEVFYAVTIKGASYTDMKDEYKVISQAKSPYNVMHESMVRDLALSFVRNFPEWEVKIRYDKIIKKLKPDLTIYLTHKETGQKLIYLVEAERKKTMDRIVNDKISKYEKIMSSLNFKEAGLEAPVKILFVFASRDYNPFWRPQEYSEHLDIIQKQDKLLRGLIEKCQELPDHRYRFLPFYQFHKIHEQVWITPHKQLINLI